MRFRPCIDLHGGRVKQIVGGTLDDDSPAAVVTNFVADESPAHFAELYRRDGLTGGHVIMLGPGNDQAAEAALSAFPGGLQVGGGIDAAGASGWLLLGAQKVIVTSCVFSAGEIHWENLRGLVATVGADKLVLDLSCRRVGKQYIVATDRWQKLTAVPVSGETLGRLARSCSEFLVHGVDVEGRQAGIDRDLVSLLATSSPIPTTYAGGVRNMDDLRLIDELGEGRIDATAGSALDIFGGTGLTYADVVEFDRARR